MGKANPTHDPAPSGTHRTTAVGLAVAAAGIITAITGTAFWLSYAHLHDVADMYGLHADTARAWAWPAVLDLFYLAGELLILRASYLRTVDPWAIALTALGALGSIGLNVAGVGTGAPILDYVVAAVPPVASLMAFGALMQQVHRWFGRPRADGPSSPVAAPVVERVQEQQTPVVPPLPAEPPTPQLPAAEPEPEAVPIRYSDPRCAVIRPLYDSGYRPTTTEMRAALEAARLAAPSASTLRGILRPEIERHEPSLADLPARPSPLHRAG